MKILTNHMGVVCEKKLNGCNFTHFKKTKTIYISWPPITLYQGYININNSQQLVNSVRKISLLIRHYTLNIHIPKTGHKQHRSLALKHTHCVIYLKISGNQQCTISVIKSQYFSEISNLNKSPIVCPKLLFP